MAMAASQIKQISLAPPASTCDPNRCRAGGHGLPHDSSSPRAPVSLPPPRLPTGVKPAIATSPATEQPHSAHRRLASGCCLPREVSSPRRTHGAAAPHVHTARRGSVQDRDENTIVCSCVSCVLCVGLSPSAQPVWVCSCCR